MELTLNFGCTVFRGGALGRWGHRRSPAMVVASMCLALIALASVASPSTATRGPRIAASPRMVAESLYLRLATETSRWMASTIEPIWLPSTFPIGMGLVLQLTSRRRFVVQTLDSAN